MRTAFKKLLDCSCRIRASRWVKPGLTLTALCLCLALLWTPGVQAQTASPTPQFDVLGFIQEATLGVDPDTGLAVCAAADPKLLGGTMKVNGHKLIVPCNSIVQMPAAAFTWADLFNPNVAAPVGATLGTNAAQQAAGQTKLALADNPMPFPSFEVRATGNIVNGQYIVGMIVPVTQQGLNAGAGIITCIDYTNGSFRVGGTIDPLTSACPAIGATGALVQINDPVGRYGKPHSPDQRFSSDTANPTIHHATGYPACIPRVAPPLIDEDCPLYNRPPNVLGSLYGAVDPFLATGAPLKNFMMPVPPTALCTGGASCTPNPLKQAPFMVGDYINFAGTLFKIDPGLTSTTVFVANPVTGLSTAIPLPINTAANTYISAHTVGSNVGIFTQPGVPPAYLTVEDLLIGTNGAAQAGILQEASTRLTVVGFTTDPTRLVDVNAIDVNPCTGAETFRHLATIDPATDAIVGRFVMRVLGGLFMPPTREYQVKSKTQVLDTLLQPVDFFAANGLLTGQYRLPNFEYIFPENHRLGDPIIANNYQDLPFLAFGSGRITGTILVCTPTTPPVCTFPSVQIGQISPWPGAGPYNPAPTPPNCSALGAAPIVTVTPVISVATNAQVTLTGTIAWDLNSDPATRTAVWKQTLGTSVGALTTTLVGGTASTTFISPATAGALQFSLTASDSLGSTTVFAAVNVVAGGDIVQIPAGLSSWVIQRGQRGGFGKLNVTATSSNPAAVLTLTETPADPGLPIMDWGTGFQAPGIPGTYNWVELKGAPLPASLTVRSSLGGSATVTCTAPDARGRVSCP